MKNNELKNINLLGHKRNKTNQIFNDEPEIFEEEKSKPNNLEILSSKKLKFISTLIEKEKRINLEEKKETRIDYNINIGKNICQICNSGDNVLCFSSFKNILDYLSKQKIFPFKNFDSNENLIFIPPKMICLNCLLTISKNKTDFEKFIGSKKNKHNYDNDFDNPFHDLYENPNLKFFNDIDPKKKKL